MLYGLTHITGEAISSSGGEAGEARRGRGCGVCVVERRGSDGGRGVEDTGGGAGSGGRWIRTEYQSRWQEVCKEEQEGVESGGRG